MGVPAYVYDFFTQGYKSVAFGTPIRVDVPGKDGKRLALLDGRVTAAGTAHTLSFMFANGTGSRNSASAAMAIGATHLFTVDAPKDPAGNAAATPDIIAYQCADGTWEFNLITSIAGSDITLTNVTVKATLIGAKVMIFGVVGDASLFALAVPASAQAKFGEGRLCIVHPYVGEPFAVSDNNITATGSIDNLVFGYINR